MPLIIGYGHASQNGKDTVVEATIEAYRDRYDIRRYAFADDLKLEVYAALLDAFDPFWAFLRRAVIPQTLLVFDLLPKPLDGGGFATPPQRLEWVNQNKVALRRVLQLYGLEYRRGQDPFYWVKAIKKRIERENPDIALITDLRFLSEAYFIKSTKGWTVRVIREGYVNEGAAGHASESELNDYEYDYVLSAAEGNVAGLKADGIEVLKMILRDVTPPALTTDDFTEVAFGAA